MEPPQPVLVDLAQLLPPRRRWGRDTPLWVRAEGIPAGPVPALLHEWLLTAAGSWVGRVTLALDVEGRRLVLDQLVPADLLRPAPQSPPG